MLLIKGCIYEFDPEISGSRDILVINGKVTDQEGNQYIEISRSTTPYEPENSQPVSGYVVEIQDDEGNVFTGTETEPGLYACWIAEEFLVPGTRYKLNITSGEGITYTSDFVELLPCPKIDSISYEIQELPTENPEVVDRGVQFFISTDCTGEYAKNYRWELEETWEYHSAYEIWVYYDGEIQVPDGSSYEYFNCWKSNNITEIYTFSTRNLTSGQIRDYPLHFVNNQSDRLSVKYSLLVKQFSLSKAAYDFWKILEEQSKQSGEMYETQPAEISGNIYSLEQVGETVLGLFYATSVKEKRIFVRPEIVVRKQICDPYLLDRAALMELLTSIPISQYPVYLFSEEEGVYDYASQSCFDCRLLGGTIEPPEFWE
jgi:hypothetical protein